MKKDVVQQYIGNQAQIGGTRHYILTDGWGRNLRAVDINSGSGLHYTVLPDRGMDISLASFKGINLVYLTCNGETHPAYFEPENIGWLHTFAGGLLTTCGLTYLGGPVQDDGEQLGLHGRYSTIPARQVTDLSGWNVDQYIIKLRGTVEEGHLFGNKLRLDREIVTVLGRNVIQITDQITNFGYRESPYTILYHMNFGYPLLSEEAELIIDPVKTVPRDNAAASGIDDFKQFIKPAEGFSEQVFFHTLKPADNGDSVVILQNKKIGITVTIKFKADTLPYLTQWKMMGPGEYVVGLEPGNVHGKNRKTLKEENMLPYLQPGESVVNRIEVILTSE